MHSLRGADARTRREDTVLASIFEASAIALLLSLLCYLPRGVLRFTPNCRPAFLPCSTLSDHTSRPGTVSPLSPDIPSPLLLSRHSTWPAASCLAHPWALSECSPRSSRLGGHRPGIKINTTFRVAAIIKSQQHFPTSSLQLLSTTTLVAATA